MKLYYIAPTLNVLPVMLEEHLLDNSMVISSKTVSEGWAKEAVHEDIDWDDED